MSDAVIHSFVRISGAFGAEFPYRPVLAVAGVEEGDQAVEGVAVGSLGVGLGWS
jgi:hypothetical protein